MSLILKDRLIIKSYFLYIKKAFQCSSVQQFFLCLIINHLTITRIVNFITGNTSEPN